jgi:hypothetical protein
MQRSFFPDSDELLMHPNPRAIAALSPEAARALMHEQLSEEEQTKIPDADRVMGLGQLARLMKLERIDSDLAGWLDEHPTPSGLDIASLFAAGYWAKEGEPSPLLVAQLLAGLQLHLPPLLEKLRREEILFPSVGVVDSLVLALGSGYFFSGDADLRGQIKSAFAPVTPVGPYLQSASKSSLERVVGVPVGSAPPPFAPQSYKAFGCRGGEQQFYLIERRVTEKPTLRVNTLELQGDKLLVGFEALDPNLNDRWAKDLIAQCLLVDLLEGSYARVARLVVYNNERTQSSSSGLHP